MAHQFLKQNNHALYIADLLAKQGKNYHWIWEDCHLGYDIYDEGIAIFSKYPIIDTKVIPLSKTQDHTNYKTRKALAICCEVNQRKNMGLFLCIWAGGMMKKNHFNAIGKI